MCGWRERETLLSFHVMFGAAHAGRLPNRWHCDLRCQVIAVAFCHRMSTASLSTSELTETVSVSAVTSYSGSMQSTVHTALAAHNRDRSHRTSTRLRLSITPTIQEIKGFVDGAFSVAKRFSIAPLSSFVWSTVLCVSSSPLHWHC